MSEQSNANLEVPKVGLGLLIVRGNEVLLGKRQGSHGVGEYGGPGGHLEYGESFEECVARELLEEAGQEIIITNIAYLCTTSLLKYMPKHYVDIGMTADWVTGEPKIMEPNKLQHWGWYNLEFLPEPLFGCTQNYVEARKTGQPYFETR